LSIKLITACRERLDVTHGELLVAIEIADAVNDAGEGCSVGVKRLARRSRQDARTVQRQLSKFRKVGWLLVVEAGGLAGGRGRATRYRINPAWVKGDSLPGFPDLPPEEPLEENDDTLSPFVAERVTDSAERVTKPPVKGDTALSPDPSDPLPSGARARAIPSGSRSAKTAEETEAVEAAAKQLRASFGSQVMGSMLGLAPFYDAARGDTGKPKPTGWEDLTTAARVVMPDVVRRLVDRAVAMANDIPPAKDSVISATIESELVLELKQFRKPSVADRQAAA
jgi:hypothetical protein